MGCINHESQQDLQTAVSLCCLLVSFLRLYGIARLAIDRHIVPTSIYLLNSPLLASYKALGLSGHVTVGCEAMRSRVTLVEFDSPITSNSLVAFVVAASNDHVVDLKCLSA